MNRAAWNDAALDRLWPGPLLRDRLLLVVRRLDERRDELAKDPLDAQALHEYRKAARRTWAAVQLTQTYLTPLRYADAFVVAASLAKGLGPVRDHDVLAQRIAELAEQHPAHRKDLERVVPALRDRKRRRRIKRVVRKGRPTRMRRLDRALAEMADVELDPRAVMRAALAIRSRGIHANSPLQALHALRLELKGHRYALEALQMGAEGSDGGLAQECHAATDALGRIIDAHLLARAANKARGAAGPAILAAARDDDQQGRADFIDGWTTRWPLLAAEIARRAQPHPPEG